MKFLANNEYHGYIFIFTASAHLNCSASSRYWILSFPESRVNDKTIEILIQLLGHIKEHSLDIESLSDFSESLVIRGYSENEIAEALGWLFERFSPPNLESTDIIAQKKESVRVLSDFERLKIPPRVYGYLLKLQSMSLINGPQMERILEYCMILSPHLIAESDIDEIVANILFDDYT
ncbi:MAG: DUF494 family protein [Candidatus Latescibacterota bacterium]